MFWRPRFSLSWVLLVVLPCCIVLEESTQRTLAALPRVSAAVLTTSSASFLAERFSAAIVTVIGAPLMVYLSPAPFPPPPPPSPRAAGKNPAEATDLRSEARTLFAQNAGLTEAATIEAKLFEGESRLDLATFYGIAAPRLPHVVPGATGRTRETILPAYMHSYGDK